MDIYRPVDGVYRCINNPQNKRRYVLKKEEGFYPALVPVDGQPYKQVPVLDFSDKSAAVPDQAMTNALISKATVE